LTVNLTIAAAIEWLPSFMHEFSQIAAQDHLTLEQISTKTVDAGFQVHRQLGPGLLESVYERCMAIELQERGLSVECQLEVPVFYKGQAVGIGYRTDIRVNSRLIIEIKSVQEILPVHQAQLITYLKLSRCRVGFLMNFNAALFKHGVRRIAL
jgi:GxxExxY protein